MYTLEPLAYEDSDLWEEILTGCPNSLPFHSIAWCHALADAFKQLTPAYFWIKDNGKIVGGLPAFVFQPIRGIKMLHSMPWNLFGGVQLVAEASVDLDLLFQTVDTHLDELVSEQGLCETVFTLSPSQTAAYGQRLNELGYQKYEDLFTHLLKTQPDYDVVWAAYRGAVRTAVRKATKTGVTIYDTDRVGDLESFYEIYLATQKRLGGTPKPLPLLKSLFRSDIAKLAIAKHSGLIIAGLLCLHFNRTVTVWVNASVPEFWEYCPNDALYHHAIKGACESGYEWVDLGASPPDNEGLVFFKEAFGAKRSDFCSYIKIHSPIKRAVWEKSEPTLRQIYTWVQQTRS
ncbi:MAG: peptidoglycan bridge formation glycyltransferase FemA/FemB family protein [Candidatus Poribacteria bacterium]|nr:peptidoglycan bridge formation glycyltransferase FemA/FemB family protein [Candidatus Poribacteria bacterium]